MLTNHQVYAVLFNLIIAVPYSMNIILYVYCQDNWNIEKLIWSELTKRLDEGDRICLGTLDALQDTTFPDSGTTAKLYCYIVNHDLSLHQHQFLSLKNVESRRSDAWVWSWVLWHFFQHVQTFYLHTFKTCAFQY